MKIFIEKYSVSYRVLHLGIAKVFWLWKNSHKSQRITSLRLKSERVLEVEEKYLSCYIEVGTVKRVFYSIDRFNFH